MTACRRDRDPGSPRRREQSAAACGTARGRRHFVEAPRSASSGISAARRAWIASNRRPAAWSACDLRLVVDDDHHVSRALSSASSPAPPADSRRPLGALLRSGLPTRSTDSVEVTQPLAGREHRLAVTAAVASHLLRSRLLSRGARQAVQTTAWILGVRRDGCRG